MPRNKIPQATINHYKSVNSRTETTKKVEFDKNDGGTLPGGDPEVATWLNSWKNGMLR